MLVIIALDILVVGGLLAIAFHKGTERTLPFLAFCLLLLPQEAVIQLPGLFDLTPNRLAIITFFILSIILGTRSSPALGESRVPLIYLMILQLFWYSVATANSPVFAVSLKATISQALDFFLLYYIVAKTVSTTDTIHKLLTAVFMAMSICSVLAYFEAYHGWTVMQYLPIRLHRFGEGGNLLVDAARGTRARATFPHAILLGSALSMAIPIGFYLLTLAKSQWRKIVLWAGLLLMFMAIYRSMSRGPWIALILSLVVMFLFLEGETRKRMMYVALLTVAVLVIRPGVWDVIKNTYVATLAPGSMQYDSYQWRYTLLELAKETVGKSVDRQLWGYGPESFFYLNLMAEYEGRMVPAETCDSSIAALIIETGYLGLLFTSLVMIMAAVTVLRDFRALPKPYDQLSLMLFVNIMAFCFMMTNVAIYGWGQQNYILWIMVALGVVYPRLVQAQDGAPAGEMDRQLAGLPPPLYEAFTDR